MEKRNKKMTGMGVRRLLDANLNRCREGLRVLEDTARFVWNEPKLFHVFRKVRHKLDKLSREHYPVLIQARHSENDEGRVILEGKRENTHSVVIANFRRCEESLRVLEEYSKVFTNGAGQAFKKIRFKIYELEKQVLTRNHACDSFKAKKDA